MTGIAVPCDLEAVAVAETRICPPEKQTDSRYLGPVPRPFVRQEARTATASPPIGN